MITSKEFLREQLQSIYNKLYNIEISYEFRTGTHIIKIAPEYIYNNNEYIELEIELEEAFLKKFPNEEIMFISNNSLTEIKNAEFVFLPTLNLSGLKKQLEHNTKVIE